MCKTTQWETGVPRVTALICTLNEAENLPHVLPKIPDWVDQVLIVDGRSTDGTVDLARRLRPGVHVCIQPGRGKGDALQYGVRHARGDVIVTLDADGETDPLELPAFVQAVLRGADFAKGSRLAGGRPRRMPIYRWVGNSILTMTFNLLYRTRFTDVCSGYTAFRKQTFLQLRLTYNNCEMEQQLLARARKLGMTIVEVPHRSDGRIAGASKVSGIKQGFIDWLVILKERFTS
jgi:glycosyltransferase involved in cell wall biosynthesis